MEKQLYPYKTIESLNILFYNSLINPSPVQYTTMHSLCYSLLKILPDKHQDGGNKAWDKNKSMKRLKELSINAFQGYDLTTLEYIAFREMRFGSKLNTPFNYGYRKKPIYLAQILTVLNKIKSELLQIFVETLISNELDTSLIMPVIQEDKSSKTDVTRGL